MPSAVRVRKRDLTQRLRTAALRQVALSRARAARLDPVVVRPVPPSGLLAIAVLRDEAVRLDLWLAHLRAQGVAHILAVDDGSTDGTADRLATEPEVSLWRGLGGYRDARWGMDWVNALAARHAIGRWVVVVDADERLVAPGPLLEVAARLEARGWTALCARMVEPFPRGPLDRPDGSGLWVDPAPLSASRHAPTGARLLRGGPRAALYPGRPDRAPVQSKLPFLRWDRRSAFLVGTHVTANPAHNRALEADRPMAAILHDKLGPDAPARARTEAARGAHFTEPAGQADYYARLAEGPDLWTPAARPFTGPDDLLAWGWVDPIP